MVRDVAVRWRKKEKEEEEEEEEEDDDDGDEKYMMGKNISVK